MTTASLDLETLVLKNGSHSRRSSGACLMEAVAWFAGEKHSDRPECTDVVLAAFGRTFNDRLRDDERQLLKPLIPTLVNTAGSRDLSRRRAFLLVDRSLRSILPMWFRSLPGKPRPDVATRLEALDPIVDEESAKRARVLARELRDELRSALSPAAYAAYADAYAAYAAYDAAAAAAASAAYAAYADAYDAYAAAAAAAAAAAYAAAAAAYAAYAAPALKALRQKTIEASIESFKEAIALTEAPQ